MERLRMLEFRGSREAGEFINRKEEEEYKKRREEKGGKNGKEPIRRHEGRVEENSQG
jgi:hypothetical protein